MTHFFERGKLRLALHCRRLVGRYILLRSSVPVGAFIYIFNLWIVAKCGWPYTTAASWGDTYCFMQWLLSGSNFWNFFSSAFCAQYGDFVLFFPFFLSSRHLACKGLEEETQEGCQYSPASLALHENSFN